MADVSLDDYIQKKKIGVPKMDVKITRTGVQSRLGGASGTPRQAFKRAFGVSTPVGVVDARTKILRVSDTPVVVVKPQLDARNLLGNKRTPTSVQDARVRLSQKKMPGGANPLIRTGSLMKLGIINDFVSPSVTSFGTFESPVRPNMCVKDIGGQLRKTFINSNSVPPLSMPLQRPYTRPAAQNPQPAPSLMRPSLKSSYQQQQQQKQQQASTSAARQDADKDQQQQQRMEVDERAVVEEEEQPSPLQSFRVIVSNLGPNVSYEDVEELFGSCGAMRKVRMLKPGSAEVFYVNKESAYVSVDEYHKRELDDKPMSVKVSFLQATGSAADNKPLRSKKQMASLKKVLDLDASIIKNALFSSMSFEQTPNVDFTVHL